MDRRNLLQTLSTGLITSIAFSEAPMYAASRTKNQTTHSLPILEPSQFGAKGDGKTLDSPAINAAIDACEQQGGGIVYLRPGTYLSGTIVLKSNVTFYLEAGSVILGSKDLAQYTPQLGPALESDAGQRHLIFAKNAENVSILGSGLINGQGPAFWKPSGRNPLPPEQHWQDVATYDWKPMHRVSPMLEFVGCKRLRLEQVRIENSSGWTMRLINCDQVVVDGIAIKNPIIGPNTDGIDISNSQNVFIANSFIDTGDDAICLKSENPYGNTVPVTKNIVVTNCILSCCCNAFKIGTRTNGGFENIAFSNSVIFNDDVDLNARVISGIAIEVVDGGWIDGVNILGIQMRRTRTPLFMRLGNRTPGASGKPGYLKRVMISDIQATESILTSSITGLSGFPIEDVTLSNIRIDSAENGKREWANLEIPELPQKYPEARMFGRLPAYGLYCRHVQELRIRDFILSSGNLEQRPAIVCEDVKNLEVTALRVPEQENDSPVISLQNVQNCWIRDGKAPHRASSYLKLGGSETSNVLLSGCDLRSNSRPVSQTDEVHKSAVTLSGNIS